MSYCLHLIKYDETITQTISKHASKIIITSYDSYYESSGLYEKLNIFYKLLQLNTSPMVFIVLLQTTPNIEHGKIDSLIKQIEAQYPNSIEIIALECVTQEHLAAAYSSSFISFCCNLRDTAYSQALLYLYVCYNETSPYYHCICSIHGEATKISVCDYADISNAKETANMLHTLIIRRSDDRWLQLQKDICQFREYKEDTNAVSLTFPHIINYSGCDLIPTVHGCKLLNYPIHVRLLDEADVLRCYKNANTKLIILNYEGIADYIAHNSASNIYLLDIIKKLKCMIWVITNGSPDVMKNIFKGIDNVILSNRECTQILDQRNTSEWKPIGNYSTNEMQNINEFINTYKAQFDMMQIINAHNTIRVRIDCLCNESNRKELINKAKEIVNNSTSMQMAVKKHEIIIRMRPQIKSIVQQIQQLNNINFILCVGISKQDNELFTQVCTLGSYPIFTATLNPESTTANYYTNPQQLNSILTNIMPA